MKTVAIHDAKTNLSKYIAAAKRGEKIYIGHRGEPEIELVYHKPKPKVYRKLGVLKGSLSPKDVDDLLSYDDHNDPEWQAIIKQMNDGPIFPDEKNPT